MDLAVLALAGLTMGAPVLGAAAAGSATRLAPSWPSFSGGSLRQRVAALLTRPPSRRRRIAGAALLACLLAAGELGAYAAQPSAPEEAPDQVIQVLSPLAARG